MRPTENDIEELSLTKMTEKTEEYREEQSVPVEKRREEQRIIQKNQNKEDQIKLQQEREELLMQIMNISSCLLIMNMLYVPSFKSGLT